MATLWPRFFVRALAFFHLFIAGIVAGFEALRWRLRWFAPSVAVSLALDHLARALDPVRKPMARFKAFMSNALTHPAYIDGHFDPGRA